MKKILAALLLALAVAFPAHAQIISPLPYTLTNGTVADADEVMSNFNQIRGDCNTNCAKSGANSDITNLSALNSLLNAPGFAPTTASAGTATLYRISSGIPAISSNSSEAIRWDLNQSTILHSQSRIATTASGGWLYIGSVLGTPTGTPTTVSNTVPVTIDETNNLFYFYSNAAWRTAGGITTILGTSNQITASTVGTTTTLSIPVSFMTPGSISATTTISANSEIYSRNYPVALNGWVNISADTSTTQGLSYLVDTSAVSKLSVYLPTSPSVGNTVRFVDAASSFATNGLDVRRNGQPIMGLSEDMSATTNNAAFGLVYQGATNGWRLF